MFVLRPKSRIATSGPPSDGSPSSRAATGETAATKSWSSHRGTALGRCTSLVRIGLAGRGHDGPQAAVRPQVPGQGPGVDAGDGRDARLAQHRGQLAGVIEHGRRGVGHDQAAQPGPLRLVVVVDAGRSCR